MSEAFRCFTCGGHGYIVIEGDEGDQQFECECCKGSGGLNLRCAGSGIPPSDDPYVPVPKGANW